MATFDAIADLAEKINNYLDKIISQNFCNVTNGKIKKIVKKFKTFLSSKK